MKVYIQTFGCQMNVHDSQRIGAIMECSGHEVVDDASQADIAVVNSCSVREKARHKAMSAIGRLRALRNRGRRLTLVMAGCVAEQDAGNLFELLPGLDVVVGPDHYRELPILIERARERGERSIVTGFDDGGPASFLRLLPRCGEGRATAYVTVMKGCEERCAYCIVPSVRGPERFRPPEDVVAEVEDLVQRGVREVMLLGQKVNAYRFGGVAFVDLIERLDRVEGLERLRFTSPHPRHMDARLISAFREFRVLCESIHLPVQSGSDRVLARMGRHYSVSRIAEIVDALRASCDGILVSTDLIVGFPGETDKDFALTLDLVAKTRFSSIFSFKYSVRPGTPAAAFEDDVPPEEKARRLMAVHTLQAGIEREIRESYVGKILDVLVEGEGREPGQFTGRARNNQIVNFESAKRDRLRPTGGWIAPVEVTRAMPHCLVGRLAERENTR